MTATYYVILLMYLTDVELQMISVKEYCHNRIIDLEKLAKQYSSMIQKQMEQEGKLY